MHWQKNIFSKPGSLRLGIFLKIFPDVQRSKTLPVHFFQQTNLKKHPQRFSEGKTFSEPKNRFMLSVQLFDDAEYVVGMCCKARLGSFELKFMQAFQVFVT